MARKLPSSRRKGWEQLSPAYRKRLERSGITKATYGKGANLAKARGKVSSQQENTRRQFWRLAERAGFDRQEVQEVIETIGFEEANDILTYREMALKGNNPFAAGAMRVLYGQYAGVVPKEWLYYGGHSYK